MPRPRARSSALSPKCSRAAVHSEHQHRSRVRGVWFRPAGLPAAEYGSELEARIEKFIFACRFMTFLAIGGSLVGSVPCFLKGCVYVMDAFIVYHLHGEGMSPSCWLKQLTCFLLERSCLSSEGACRSCSSVTLTTLMAPTSLSCSGFRNGQSG